jgi:hypothetical protein
LLAVLAAVERIVNAEAAASGAPRPPEITPLSAKRRLVACNEKGVTFKWKDYGLEGRERYKLMTLTTDEFIRRFLMHVLPAGFHRIRYLLASAKRADNIARARELLALPIIPVDASKAANTNADQPQTPEHRCSRVLGLRGIPLQAKIR